MCQLSSKKIIGRCKRNADSLRNIAFLLSQNLFQDAVLIALLSLQKGQVYQYFFHDLCMDLVHSDRNVSKHEKCLDEWLRVLVEVSLYGQISIESKIN